MWFKNLVVFSFENDWSAVESSLDEQLHDKRLKPCPKHAYFSTGWVEPLKQYVDQLVHRSHQERYLVLGRESRILPSGVIRESVEERVNQYERENAKPAGRALRGQFKEELEFELLPKAFTVQKKQWLYIDTLHKRILIDTVSLNNASNVVAELIKTLGTMSISPLAFEGGMKETFSNWLQHPLSLPSGLTLGKTCKLVSPKQAKSAYQCKDIDTHLDDITALLDGGLSVSEIELIWQDRLQFVLTESFTFKRIRYLDCLEDRVKENSELEDATLIMDANLALMSENFSALISFFEALDEQMNLSVSKKDSVNVA